MGERSMPREGRRRRRSGREILPLTLDRLADLPDPCAGCAFWESPPTRGGGPAADKRAWLTGVLLDWGSPGRIAYVDGVAAGFLSYAPAGLAPRTLAFPTSPVSADALVLLTARLRPEYAGQGLGRVLVQTAAKDALRRGHRALEVFGRPATVADRPERSERSEGPRRPERSDRPGEHESCLLPADFLTAVGFATVREHPAYPRLRLDLGTALRWRAEMESAVERLFAPVRDLGPAPVGSAHRGSLRTAGGPSGGCGPSGPRISPTARP